MNPQIVVVSAVYRLIECFGFFYMYYKYLDEVDFSSNMIKMQIRISIVFSSIYAYILFFQIFYVIVASVTNMRESVDDAINMIQSNQLGISLQQSYLKNSSSVNPNPIRNSNGVNSNKNGLPVKGSKSNRQQKEFTTNVILPSTDEQEANFKTAKLLKRNRTTQQQYKQLQCQNIITSPVETVDKNCSFSSSTDNVSEIFQIDLEENQGFQALKIFNPNVNNFPIKAD